MICKNGIVKYDIRDQEVIVRSKGRKLRTPFSVIGVLRNKMNNNMKDDVFDALSKVSKSALLLFNDFKYLRDMSNNTCVYDKSAMNKTQKETFSRLLNELKCVGLVCRVKRELAGIDHGVYYKFAKDTYIINPDMLRCIQDDDAMYFWKQCKGEIDVK